MTTLLSSLDHPLILALGWTLLHFLWQGTVAALVFAATRAALGRSSANARYLAGCAGMLLLAACPVVTFVSLAISNDRTVIPTSTGSVSVRESVVTGPLESAPSVVSPTPNTASLGQDRLAARIQRVLPWVVSGWSGAVSLLALRLLMGYAGFGGSRRKHRRLSVILGQQAPARGTTSREPSVQLCQSALVKCPQ